MLFFLIQLLISFSLFTLLGIFLALVSILQPEQILLIPLAILGWYLTILTSLLIIHRIARFFLKLEGQNPNSKNFGWKQIETEWKKFWFIIAITAEDIIWNLVTRVQFHSPFPIEIYRLLGLKTGKDVDIFARLMWPCQIVIGDRVLIGMFTVVTARVTQKGRMFTAPIEFGNDVFIGGRSTVALGVKVSDNVIVGAGSLVPPNKTLDSDYMYAGAPIKQIQQISPGDGSSRQ